MISFGCFFDDFNNRRFLDFIITQKLPEHRCLEDAEPNPQTNPDKDDREREPDAPAPGSEQIARPSAESQYRKVRQEQTAGDAELRPRRHQAALAMMTRPFHRQQHRTARFPADADTLDHPQKGQNYCTPDPDHLVGGHKGDQDGRDAHAQQGGNQGRFAADAITVVTEYRGADRAADKADEVGAEGCQGSR